MLRAYFLVVAVAGLVALPGLLAHRSSERHLWDRYNQLYVGFLAIYTLLLLLHALGFWQAGRLSRWLRSETGKKTVLAVLATLLSVYVADVVLKRLVVVTAETSTPFTRASAQLHHEHVPAGETIVSSSEYRASIRLNSLGLRNREVARDKPPGVFRILVLGDSFTLGLGVSDHEVFTEGLQRALAAATGGTPGIEVLNGGVVSYSPLLEYVYLKTRGMALHPDLVLLLFDVTDLTDDADYAEKAVFTPEGEPLAVDAARATPAAAEDLRAIDRLRFLVFDAADAVLLQGYYIGRAYHYLERLTQPRRTRQQVLIGARRVEHSYARDQGPWLPL